ncbi:hypothetical protein SETIT_7G020000v2 [Setaria italica]|uniref:DUF4220 domain-containing protein n=1 Tax=Setaria italica TaxID=4555 RepID=A0A368RRG5_SETIT|nr:uncharacterized protein LOC101761830 [Setaria italica]RCV32654.1 hypothetical protein SETIT_7G020000v2 [Setaria italica]
MTKFGPDQLGDTHILEPRVAAERLLDFWNGWATQILVILSLTHQVILLFFSGIRRRQGRSPKRLLLWLAYQLADSTAMYALGNLSLRSTLRHNRLIAFWAPFLLLHLAGPDNITAYSLEDNKLWKRHLLTLVVQVLGAGYVVYKHIASSGILFSLGTTLMSAVAVAKFCEKTWALRCADFTIIRESLEAENTEQQGKCRLYLEDEPPQGGFKGKVVDKEEFLMLRAHAVFRVCKSAMVDSSKNPGNYVVGILKYLKENEMGYMWTLVEMELSLMYDVLYTKAPVLHTLPGYCIRVVSPLAVVASLLLFLFYGREGNRRTDIAITYILLGSAFLMEMTSLLSALWSTWTFSFLCATQWSGLRHAALCLERWHKLRRMVLSLRRLAHSIRITGFFRLSRRWSGTMGQYNMLEMCTTRPGRLAGILGYSMPAVGVPDGLKYLVVDYIQHMIKSGYVNTLGMVRKNWGTEALKRWKESSNITIKDKFLGAELHEGIIIWHIATDIFLSRRHNTKAKDKQRVKEVQILSNYMMFLLVKQPDMLPGLPQNKLYQWTKRSLATQWNEIISNGLISDSGLQPSENLASALYKELSERSVQNYRLQLAIELAKILVSTDYALDLVYEVWADFLIYTANRCSRESHAKKLNSGGEFTTLVWLMTDHLHQVSSNRHVYAPSE